MKKVKKILIPLLGVTSIAGVVAPLVSCGNSSPETKENATITFTAGAGGRIITEAKATVKTGSLWSDVTLPKVEAVDGYVFAGWYNGNVAMSKDMPVGGDMTVMAKFAVYKEVDDIDVWEDCCKLIKIDESDESTWFYEIKHLPAAYMSSIIAFPNSLAEFTEVREGDIQISSQYPVGIIALESLTGVKTICIPSNVADVYIPHSSTMTYIFVDKNNKYLSSQDKDGNECNCLCYFPETEEGKKSRVLQYGCRNTIIPNDTYAIAPSAFSYSGIKTVKLPETLKGIGEYAFENCPIEKIEIPKSVTEIGEYAFSSNIDLQEVVIPADSELTTLGRYAFNKCYRLKSFAITDKVTDIGGYVFKNCSDLESISLGEGFTYSAKNLSNLFKGCTKLTTLTISPKNKNYYGENCIISKAEDESKNVLLLGLPSTVIPNTVVGIGPSAFAASKITTIAIPNSVKQIYTGAFAGCLNLESIALPSVTEIGASAFNDCTSLATVTFGNSLKTIDSRAFEGCSLLGSIVIPESVLNLGDHTFYRCTSLITADVKTKVDISESMFEDCRNLTNVTLPQSGATKIGNRAFDSCSSLSQIQIPNTVKSIGEAAFRYCYSLVEVNIPASVEELQYEAFYDCYNLTKVKFAEGSKLEYIGDCAFEDCAKLANINLPEGLKRIGNSAFSGCYALKQLTLPKTIETMGEYVFEDCNFTGNKIDFAGKSTDWTLGTTGWWYKDSNIKKVHCADGTDIELQ